jgi:ATP-dependent DNA helicase RecG
MSESQNIEYKSSWHEEYLDWLCGFANAQLSESEFVGLKD